MKNLVIAFTAFTIPLLALAQEKGHSHGSGGETEHLYPVLGVFAALIVVGGIFYFVSNKKK